MLRSVKRNGSGYRRIDQQVTASSIKGNASFDDRSPGNTRVNDCAIGNGRLVNKRLNDRRGIKQHAA
jgi:hypothetical protein